MAAAEARAAWQRTANRCFVQEDAKRAPKLACCPPSSIPLHDTGNDNSETEPDQSVSNFMPINWNGKNSNLPLDTKWWLQLQPNYGYQKDIACEKLNILDNEFASKRIDNSHQNPKYNNDKSATLENLGDKVCDDSSFESPWMVTTAFTKHDTESKFEYTKAMPNNAQQPLTSKLTTCEYLYKDAQPIDWNQADPFTLEKPQKAVMKMEFSWEENNKCTPWWRISDIDELASFVARKSSQNIENCDLPRPTQVLVSSDPYAWLECSETTVIFSEPSCQKLHGGVCNPVDFTQHSSTSGCMDVKYESSCESKLLHGYEQKDSVCTNNTVGPDTSNSKLSDASRVQLMEALRHSQTRAREAEMAAQRAYNEKEHIVQLLFRQASQLFAYKQWFHISQLEALCLQLKIKEYQISTILPDLPWSPLRGKPGSREQRKGKKKKQQQQQPWLWCSICKKMVIFAVGLGLAGAGMLLGWTIGWLLPCI